MREMRPGCGMWTARLSKYDVIFLKNNIKVFLYFGWHAVMK
jgi:hypothetical protein